MIINSLPAIAVPFKAMLNTMKIGYQVSNIQLRQQDFVRFELEEKGDPLSAEVVIMLTEFPCNYTKLKKLFKTYRSDLSPTSLIKGYAQALEYARQLDRWKFKYERLAGTANNWPIIHYLDLHLQNTILLAETIYQRNEAIGLNLAKIELLERTHQRQCAELPVVAIAGLISYIDSDRFKQAIAEIAADRFDYYFCYSHQGLLQLETNLIRLMERYWYKHPIYFYQDGFVLDFAEERYDGLLLVSDQTQVSETILAKTQKIHKPRAIYRINEAGINQEALSRLFAKLMNKIK